MNEYEMNVDFTTMTAIQDIVDYDNQEVIRRNRKHIIAYLQDMRWESLTT